MPIAGPQVERSTARPGRWRQTAQAAHRLPRSRALPENGGVASVFDLLLHVVAIPVLFLASTIAFDVLHWLLHRAHGSRFAALRRAGGLHATHHVFLDRELRVHHEWAGANIRRHVIPEFLTQATFAAGLLGFVLVVPILPWTVVAGVFAIQATVFVLILRACGLDINHRGHEKLDAFRDTFFCMPEYHALHHVHPDSHFSSWIKALDYVLGSGLELRGRRVAFVGEMGVPAVCLRSELIQAGAHLVETGAVDEDAPEILVVAGDPEAGSTRDALTGFIGAAEAARFPSEIWWLRDAAAGGRLPGITRRIQLRRLDVRPGTGAHTQARRWMRGLLRGRCRV
jgi:hypothetical protein